MQMSTCIGHSTRTVKHLALQLTTLAENYKNTGRLLHSTNYSILNTYITMIDDGCYGVRAQST